MDLETRPLDPIGVEIHGLTLGEGGGGPSEETLAALRRTVVDEGLALLRGQRLTPDEQVALGCRLGPLEPMDLDRDGRAPVLGILSNVGADGAILAADDPRMRLVRINERWHTDSAFREVPASFSIFTAVVVPETGGDTFFASLERAWQTLSGEDRKGLLGLNGIHDYRSAYRSEADPASVEPISSDPRVDFPVRLHPIARRHPESGRTSLYVAEHMGGVEGWPEARGRALVSRLVAVATHEGAVYRHRWRAGDVLIWDNRTMIHRAQGFDPRHARVMHHVRVAGSEPPIPASR